MSESGLRYSSRARLGFLRRAQAPWLDQHMREVLRGSLTAFPLRAIGACLAFALNVLLARLLGAEGMGLYALALTVTAVAGTLASLGLGNVLVRSTAAGAAREDWPDVRAVAALGTRIALICALAATAVLVVCAPWVASEILDKPALAAPLQWMALTIVPQTQVRLHAQLLRGLKKIAWSQFLLNVGVPLLTIILVAGLGGSYGVEGAVWAYLLAYGVNLAAALGTWRRTIGSIAPGTSLESHPGSATAKTRELLASGFPILQINLLNLAIVPATTIMLGAFGAAASVAIFAVAARTAMLSRFALVAVNAIAAPKFAALHGAADRKALASTARRSTFLIALAASPLLIVLLVFPAWTMSLFGPEFEAGAQILVILAIGQFAATISGSVRYLLMMSGNEKLLRLNTAIAAAACIGLNFVLIPQFGATGAAIGVATGVVLRSALGSIQVYRCLGILPFFIPAPEAPNDDS